jgi:hypothetical protein
LKYSAHVKQFINKNLFAILEIFTKLKEKKEKSPDYWGSVTNYFEIENDNKKSLSFEEK